MHAGAQSGGAFGGTGAFGTPAAPQTGGAFGAPASQPSFGGGFNFGSPAPASSAASIGKSMVASVVQVF